MTKFLFSDSRNQNPSGGAFSKKDAANAKKTNLILPITQTS